MESHQQRHGVSTLVPIAGHLGSRAGTSPRGGGSTRGQTCPADGSLFRSTDTLRDWSRPPGLSGELAVSGTYPCECICSRRRDSPWPTGWGVTHRTCNQIADGGRRADGDLHVQCIPDAGSWRTLGANHRLKGMSRHAIRYDIPVHPSRWSSEAAACRKAGPRRR